MYITHLRICHLCFICICHLSISSPNLDANSQPCIMYVQQPDPETAQMQGGQVAAIPTIRFTSGLLCFVFQQAIPPASQDLICFWTWNTNHARPTIGWKLHHQPQPHKRLYSLVNRHLNLRLEFLVHELLAGISDACTRWHLILLSAQQHSINQQCFFILLLLRSIQKKVNWTKPTC